MYIGPWQEYRLSELSMSRPSKGIDPASLCSKMKETLQEKLSAEEAQRLMDIVSPLLDDLPRYRSPKRSRHRNAALPPRTTRRRPLPPAGESVKEPLRFPPIRPPASRADSRCSSLASDRDDCSSWNSVSRASTPVIDIFGKAYSRTLSKLNLEGAHSANKNQDSPSHASLQEVAQALECRGREFCEGGRSYSSRSASTGAPELSSPHPRAYKGAFSAPITTRRRGEGETGLEEGQETPGYDQLRAARAFAGVVRASERGAAEHILKGYWNWSGGGEEAHAHAHRDGRRGNNKARIDLVERMKMAYLRRNGESTDDDATVSTAGYSFQARGDRGNGRRGRGVAGCHAASCHAISNSPSPVPSRCSTRDGGRRGVSPTLSLGRGHTGGEERRSRGRVEAKHGRPSAVDPRRGLSASDDRPPLLPSDLELTEERLDLVARYFNWGHEKQGTGRVEGMDTHGRPMKGPLKGGNGEVGGKGKGLDDYIPPRTQAPQPLPPPSKCLAHALGGCNELCKGAGGGEQEGGKGEDCVAELLRWVEDLEDDEDCTICSRTTHASCASVQDK